MSDRRQVVLIGLDAADKDLVLNWIDEGVLPNLRALRQGGAWAPVLTPPRIYNGSIWPSFHTGLSPARHRQYFNVKLDGYSVKAGRRTWVKQPPLWRILSEHGKRIALIDVPYAPPLETLNGIQIGDWAVHDRSFEESTGVDEHGEAVSDYFQFRVPKLFTIPESLAAEVKQFGEFHGVPSCEESGRTVKGFKELRRLLIERVRSKERLTCHLMEQERWDFLMTVFHETHDVGHECWHLHDTKSPWHDPEMGRQLGDPIRDVYVAIDEAIGRIVDKLDTDATVFVFCSHGMGPVSDGNYILDQILARLDDGPPPQRLRSVMFLNRAWSKTPGFVRAALSPVRTRIRKSVYETLVTPTRMQRKYFAIPSNGDCGGIRINLVGREPAGQVQPGAEYDAICEKLRRDLLELVEPESGEPIVRDVVTYEEKYPPGLYSEDLYNGEYLSDRADLLVVWNKSTFRFVESPKFGKLENTSQNSRRGDHRDFGLVLARGPSIKAGRSLDAVPVTDLAPTIAAIEGVTFPGADGSPVPEFCDALN
jgi:predicted AlkP superfamily phosphohydrolase/phosphomutase